MTAAAVGTETAAAVLLSAVRAAVGAGARERADSVTVAMTTGGEGADECVGEGEGRWG